VSLELDELGLELEGLVALEPDDDPLLDVSEELELGGVALLLELELGELLLGLEPRELEPLDEDDGLDLLPIEDEPLALEEGEVLDGELLVVPLAPVLELGVRLQP